jgi:hypothetical protein
LDLSFVCGFAVVTGGMTANYQSAARCRRFRPTAEAVPTEQVGWARHATFLEERGNHALSKWDTHRDNPRSTGTPLFLFRDDGVDVDRVPAEQV